MTESPERERGGRAWEMTYREPPSIRCFLPAREVRILVALMQGVDEYRRATRE